MCNFRLHSRQRGVALVSVLLIVAILLAVASRLLASHNLVINQHQNTFEQNQALQYALGAETLARQALFQDFNTTGKDIDHTGEIWARQTMPFELDEGGFLEAQMTDRQGCFNLNRLAGSEAQIAAEQLKLMAQNLGINPQIVDAWKDWIDADTEISGFGAEDSEYLISQPPYRTPNQPVVDVSELYLLQNVDREQLALLLPYVCLLPETETTLNINTVNAHTLAALDKTFTLSQVEPIVAVERSYQTVAEFVQAFPDFAPAEASLKVTSEYFLLHAQAQVGSSSVTLQSLLFRDPDSGVVTVLRRDFGKLFRSNLDIVTEEI